MDFEKYDISGILRESKTVAMREFLIGMDGEAYPFVQSFISYDLYLMREETLLYLLYYVIQAVSRMEERRERSYCTM